MKTKITVWSVVSFLLKIILMIIFIFPFYWMVITGFKTYQESIAFPPSFWPAAFQWENFVKVWNSGPYLLYMFNSFAVSIGCLVLQFLLTAAAA